MAFRVFYTDQSLEELESILALIERDNPAAAERLGHRLLNDIDLLADFPYLGTPVPGAARVRKLLQSPVRIYYSLDAQRQLITVLHFWHAARREPDL